MKIFVEEQFLCVNSHVKKYQIEKRWSDIVKIIPELKKYKKEIKEWSSLGLYHKEYCKICFDNKEEYFAFEVPKYIPISREQFLQIVGDYYM